MTKNELVYKVADRINVPRGLVMSVLSSAFDCIYTTVEDGEKVNVGAFIFKPHTRAARKGINPKTGESIDVPESKSIVCRVKLNG